MACSSNSSSFPRCKWPGAIWTKLADHSESSTHPQISKSWAWKKFNNLNVWAFWRGVPLLYTAYLFVDDVVWDCYSTERIQAQESQRCVRAFFHIWQEFTAAIKHIKAQELALHMYFTLHVATWHAKGVSFCEHLPSEVFYDRGTAVYISCRECEKIRQIQNLIENFPISGYNHREISPKWLLSCLAWS